MMAKRGPVVGRDDIARRIEDLGREITKDYQGCRPVIVGVLKGAFVFMADLVRQIDLELEVDFVQFASYGENTVSCGDVRLCKDMEIDVAGKDILVVEDIVDTGRTLACLVRMLQERQAESVRVCALLDKKERREVDVSLDYVGFEIERGFLVGYGLDCGERYRQLPEIYDYQP